MRKAKPDETPLQGPFVDNLLFRDYGIGVIQGEGRLYVTDLETEAHYTLSGAWTLEQVKAVAGLVRHAYLRGVIDGKPKRGRPKKKKPTGKRR